MILLGEDARIIPWVEERLNVQFGSATAMGFVSPTEGLLGAIVYHNWLPQYKAIEASIASVSPRWATKQALQMIFWLPFENIGANRLQATIRRRNKRSQRFVRRLGFTYEGKGREAFGDDDATVYSMLKPEWEASKWYLDLEAHDGQRLGQPAAG